MLDYVVFSFCGVILCLRNKKDLGRHLTPSSTNSCSLQPTSHAGKWGPPQSPLESLLTFPRWALGWEGMWGHSTSRIPWYIWFWITDTFNQACFYFIYLFGHTGCGILVPWPGIEPMSPTLEANIFNHWTTREVLNLLFYNC